MLIWIEAHPGLASWLQAFGSIIAIAIAIWVPYWQKKQAQAQAKLAEIEQVRHLLRNFLDEMIVVSENFGKRNGKLLLDTPAGEAFTFVIPIMEKPFPVFDGSAARLGQIPNDELRRLIITGYGHAIGFVSSIRLNNILIDRFEQAAYLNAAHNDAVHGEMVQARLLRLKSYGDTLKSAYTEAIGRMTEMREALEAELEIQ